MSCSEAVALRAELINKSNEEAASSEYLKNKTKICPGCGVNSVKIGGCDHITCRYSLRFFSSSLILTLILLGHICKHQYCWTCLADYRRICDEGNDRHETSCKWHPRNLPDIDFEDEDDYDEEIFD